jgi:hypothetical protein
MAFFVSLLRTQEDREVERLLLERTEYPSEAP